MPVAKRNLSNQGAWRPFLHALVAHTPDLVLRSAYLPKDGSAHRFQLTSIPPVQAVPVPKVGDLIVASVLDGPGPNVIASAAPDIDNIATPDAVSRPAVPVPVRQNEPTGHPVVVGSAAPDPTRAGSEKILGERNSFPMSPIPMEDIRLKPFWAWLLTPHRPDIHGRSSGQSHDTLGDLRVFPSAAIPMSQVSALAGGPHIVGAGAPECEEVLPLIEEGDPHAVPVEQPTVTGKPDVVRTALPNRGDRSHVVERRESNRFV